MTNTTYEIYDFYGETYPEDDWDAKLARTKVNELIKVKDIRLQELKNLCQLHNINLDYSIESLQKLNNFVCKEMDKEIPNIDRTNQLCCEYARNPYFRSLVIDCTIYLGEILLLKYPTYLKKWDVYKTASKRLVYRFHPSIKNAEFSYSIYTYFSTYLYGSENSRNRFMPEYEYAITHYKRTIKDFEEIELKR